MKTYFAEPSLLIGLWASITVAVLWFWTLRRQRHHLAQWGRLTTVLRLLPASLGRRRGWIGFCQTAGLACLAVALAGPLLGMKLVEFRQRGLDVMVAVDCSNSMLVKDLPPSRIEHAKLVLGQLIERLAGSRIGVIAFAGQAFIQCPLTIDAGAAKQVLDHLEPGQIPVPGSAAGEAIRLALKGMRAGEGANRVLVLLTDGEDTRGNPLDAAREAAKQGLKIFTVGIGTAQGDPIPIYDESGRQVGYKQNKKGDIVLSKLDEKSLIAIARETGGQYFPAESTGAEVDALLRTLESIEKGEQKGRHANRYENRYQWPLGVGILLLLIGLMIPEGSGKKT